MASNKKQGEKYIAIVFIPQLNQQNRAVKFKDWVTDYTLEKGYFKNFLDKKFPDWIYFNLYNKNTENYIKRIQK